MKLVIRLVGITKSLRIGQGITMRRGVHIRPYMRVEQPVGQGLKNK